jgi:hypothetical protein
MKQKAGSIWERGGGVRTKRDESSAAGRNLFHARRQFQIGFTLIEFLVLTTIQN